MNENRKTKKKKKIASKIVLAVFVVLFAVGGSVLATLQWNYEKLYSLADVDKSGTVKDISKGKTNEKGITNILLIGVDGREENNDDAGNSDTCMIATLDLNHNQIKLSSIMRDTEVNVPGYESSYKNYMHKFNALYATGHAQNGIKGGVSMVYKFILNKFNIVIDGYAVVNFSAFEEVVNAMGGVELNLTESEARNLNSTNYAKRRYRTFKIGKQTLNGNQTLAYCRIRHGKMVNGVMPAVISLTGKGDDYARTERQRYALEAIFKKFKTMSMSKWTNVVEKMLPYIKTDVDSDEVLSYLTSVITMGTTKIEQYRFPSGNVRGNYNETLGYDQQEIKALKNFITKEVKASKSSSAK